MHKADRVRRGRKLCFAESTSSGPLPAATSSLCIYRCYVYLACRMAGDGAPWQVHFYEISPKLQPFRRRRRLRQESR